MICIGRASSRSCSPSASRSTSGASTTPGFRTRATAALLWWVVLALGVAAALPGASYLLLWPLLAALVALGATFFLEPLIGEGGRVAPVSLAVLLAGAAPGLVLASSSLYLLFVASGARVVVIVVCVWLMLVSARAAHRPRLPPSPLAAAGRAGRGWRGALHRPQSGHRVRRGLAAPRQPLLSSRSRRGPRGMGHHGRGHGRVDRARARGAGPLGGRARARAALGLRPLSPRRGSRGRPSAAAARGPRRPGAPGPARAAPAPLVAARLRPSPASCSRAKQAR